MSSALTFYRPPGHTGSLTINGTVEARCLHPRELIKTYLSSNFRESDLQNVPLRPIPLENRTSVPLGGFNLTPKSFVIIRLGTELVNVQVIRFPPGLDVDILIGSGCLAKIEGQVKSFDFPPPAPAAVVESTSSSRVNN